MIRTLLVRREKETQWNILWKFSTIRFKAILCPNSNIPVRSWLQSVCDLFNSRKAQKWSSNVQRRHWWKPGLTRRLGDQGRLTVWNVCKITFTVRSRFENERITESFLLKILNFHLLAYSKCNPISISASEKVIFFSPFEYLKFWRECVQKRFARSIKIVLWLINFRNSHCAKNILVGVQYYKQTWCFYVS